jgi:hypothetical protein
MFVQAFNSACLWLFHQGCFVPLLPQGTLACLAVLTLLALLAVILVLLPPPQKGTKRSWLVGNHNVVLLWHHSRAQAIMRFLLGPLLASV